MRTDREVLESIGLFMLENALITASNLNFILERISEDEHRHFITLSPFTRHKSDKEIDYMIKNEVGIRQNESLLKQAMAGILSMCDIYKTLLFNYPEIKNAVVEKVGNDIYESLIETLDYLLKTIAPSKFK